MAIKFIYFDLGNVLLDFSHERGCRQMASVADVSAEQVREVVFDSGLNDRYERGEIGTRQFHAEFDQRTGAKTDAQELLRAWKDIFEIHATTVPAVASLAMAGYRLGILSNTCPSHWRHATEKFAMLSRFFTRIILSYDVKAMKPEPPIYEHASRATGVAASEVFFMDDREENVAGAREHGWTAARFVNALRLAGDLNRAGVEFNR